VDAVVLVGGEGTRLRPLTLSTPKQMLPIVGVPMIERVLAHLGSHGVDRAVLSLGYRTDAFTNAYRSGRAAGVELFTASEPEPLDTAGAVRFAADRAGIDDTFVVVNGDILTDLDLTALVAFHRAKGAEGTLHLYPVEDPSRFGVVPTDGDGRVTAFVEKPPRDEAPTNLINAGTYVLQPSVLGRIPAGRRVSIERETFPDMARDGTLFALADRSYWLDAGTPDAYLRAHRDLLDGVRGEPPSPGAVRLGAHAWVTGTAALDGAVHGTCWFGDGATIAPDATVSSSAVGPGAVIERGARVSDSVLLEGARVAAGSSVAGSILGAASTVGERCEVHPVTVLGDGAVVSSGSVVEGERVPA
jgi:mannose-1-phosphate guanylyltransferase